MDIFSFLTTTPFSSYFLSFSFFIFLLGLFLYLNKGEIYKMKITTKKIVFLFLGIQIFYAIFLTWAQYYVWAGSDFTKIFVNTPFDSSLRTNVFSFLPFLKDSSLGYFIYYVWGRFWMEFAITWCVAFFFWLLFSFFKKRRDYLFTKEELYIGILGILVFNWPGSIIFILVSLFTAICMSFFKLFLRKGERTTFDIVFAIAGFVTFFFGAWILNFLHLAVLQI
jgi:hypothetical protein